MLSKALIAGTKINTASQPQSSTSFSNTETKSEPLVMDLEKHLSDEDRKAGNTTLFIFSRTIQLHGDRHKELFNRTFVGSDRTIELS